jgi:hypothetical protein
MRSEGATRPNLLLSLLSAWLSPRTSMPPGMTAATLFTSKRPGSAGSRRATRSPRRGRPKWMTSSRSPGASAGIMDMPSTLTRRGRAQIVAPAARAASASAHEASPQRPLPAL